MRRSVALVLLMVVFAAACGDDEGAPTTTAAVTTTTVATTTTATTTTVATTTTTEAVTTTTRPIAEAIVGFWTRDTDAYGPQAMYFGADGEFLFIDGPDRTLAGCATSNQCDPGTYTLDGNTMTVLSEQCGTAPATLTVHAFEGSVRSLTFDLVQEDCETFGFDSGEAEYAAWLYASPTPPAE